MERRERENQTRVARGVRPLPMPDDWTKRPKLGPHERELFGEFLQLASACAGQVHLQDAIAWLDLRDVARGERAWLVELLCTMGAVLRERNDG